jgi:hypothetical protein
MLRVFANLSLALAMLVQAGGGVLLITAFPQLKSESQIQQTSEASETPAHPLETSTPTPGSGEHNTPSPVPSP